MLYYILFSFLYTFRIAGAWLLRIQTSHKILSFSFIFDVLAMKNRQTNQHFVINSSDIYFLYGNRIGMVFGGFVLTSVVRPPPPPTSPLNITTHYDKTTLRVLVVLPLREYQRLE